MAGRDCVHIGADYDCRGRRRNEAPGGHSQRRAGPSRGYVADRLSVGRSDLLEASFGGAVGVEFGETVE